MKTDNKLRKTGDSLLNIAAESANLDPADVVKWINDPDSSAQDGLDWEMYVPRSLANLWGALSEPARLAAFIVAESRGEAGRPSGPL